MTTPHHDYGERWDGSDVDALVDLCSQGWTAEEIANHLGRTRYGVSAKIARLRRAGAWPEPPE